MMVYDNNDISYVTSLHATSWQLINIIYNIKNLMVYLWFLLYLLLPSHYTKNNDIMMEFINTKYIYCYKFATYCYIFVTCSIAYPCMQVFVAVLAGSIKYAIFIFKISQIYFNLNPPKEEKTNKMQWLCRETN